MKYSFFLLFLALPLNGAQLPPDAKIEKINTFDGGLNTSVTPHKVPKNYSPATKNVLMHRKPGSLVMRNGLNIAGSTNTLMDGRFGFTAYAENGGTEFIVSDSSMLLSTVDFKTYTFISSALTTTVGLWAIQVRNKVWIGNGLDSTITWDLSTHVKQVLNGQNGLPNVPKFKYASYGPDSRVWGLNESANGSALDFCSVTVATSGEIIAPDDPRAWPPVNQLLVGRGDGTVGTALWLYNGRLYVGKESSIWIVLGGPQIASYQTYKVEPQVGPVSHDAVVLLDGYTYFKGAGGAYKFDGTRAERITDAIVPDMNAVNDATNKTLINSWDTQSDFNIGNFVLGTTATISGLIQTFGVQFSTFNDFNFDGGAPCLNAGSPSYTFPNYQIFTSSPPSQFQGYLKRITVNPRVTNSCGGANLGSANVTFTITHKGSGLTDNFTWNQGGAGTPVPFDLANNLKFTGYELLTGSFSMKVDWVSGNTMEFGGVAQSWILEFTPATTGQFTSDIATLTSVTTWGNFDSLNNTNGGNINFYLRTSTSVVNISTKNWTSIVPGTIINQPTINNYIQWAATVASISSNTISSIDKVTIEHIEGSSNRDRPFAIEWNREYWLSVATGTNNTSIQYVKAWNTNPNPNAWNRLYNQDIRSFFKDRNSTLYAGSASSGVFYILDSGTNDNGRAIEAYWDTPELDFGDSYHDKNLFEIWAQVDKFPSANFQLGISTNGADFYYKSKSINGTFGDTTLAFRDGMNIKKNSYRFRILLNELDKNPLFHDLSLIYQPTGIFSSK